METAVWLYQHYCAKHPRAVEILLGCVALLAVHVGMSYLKQAAQQMTTTGSPSIVEQQKMVPPPSAVPTTAINSANSSGDNSPATAGNGNSVQVESGAKK